MKAHHSLTFLLDKFCNNSENFTLNELQHLHHLLSDEAMAEEISQWMHRRWELDPDDCADVNFEAIFSKVERQLSVQKRAHRRWLTYLQRVAAILIVPFVGLSGFLLLKTVKDKQPVVVQVSAVVPSAQEYITPAGMRSKVLLPDSSEVWLNASSRLTVQAGFGAQTRQVELVGEAYFKVAQNKKSPFVVSTSEMDIKALGTAFNVSAYSGSSMHQTVLVEGKVEVATKMGERINMRPDQLIELNKDEGVVAVQSNVNTELYTAWTNGILIFQKTPMEDVISTLERWFNITIELRDPVLKSYRYTGTFDNRSLEQIMSYISLSSDINYKIDKDHITLHIK